VQYRTLGRSGCAVSSLALGAMTFGREANEADSHAMLDRYVEAGGNLVDTADVYGGGGSEEIVGRWFASRPAEMREHVVLATKGRFPTGTGPNQVGLSRRHLATALDDSLRRLGVERIDLYQVHAHDPLTPIEETLRFLDDAVGAGKINYVGLSNFTGWQLQRAVDLAEFRNLSCPVTLQPQYSLLAREIEWEVIPAAQANGLGLLPWSPLGGGWLTGKYTRAELPSGQTRLAGSNQGMAAYERRARLQRTWEVVEAVQSVAAELGASPAQVALAWVVDRPAVTSVILGARSMAQLEDNLGSGDVELSPEQIERLDKASDPAPADYPYGGPGREQRSRKIAGGR
jgi:aryl-alcohol dehydrogenase-like predicted oxidoreductase